MLMNSIRYRKKRKILKKEEVRIYHLIEAFEVNLCSLEKRIQIAKKIRRNLRLIV